MLQVLGTALKPKLRFKLRTQGTSWVDLGDVTYQCYSIFPPLQYLALPSILALNHRHCCLDLPCAKHPSLYLSWLTHGKHPSTTNLSNTQLGTYYRWKSVPTSLVPAMSNLPLRQISQLLTISLNGPAVINHQ